MADQQEQPLISRREAVRRVSALLGGAALVGGPALLTACAGLRPTAADLGHTPFSAGDIAFLDEMADTLLPETHTPGAKAAGVGPFIALMVHDCYSPDKQVVFRDGMQALEDDSIRHYRASFVDATPAQRLELLEYWDQEQMNYMNSKPGDAPAHWFRMMKELTLLGYFTSEIGYTQAMRYVEAPGRFDPCVPLAPGDTTWASHA
jgi:hypothetical protein